MIVLPLSPLGDPDRLTQSATLTMIERLGYTVRASDTEAQIEGPPEAEERLREKLLAVGMIPDPTAN